ncbi:ArnT family glycosyltransferase [Methanosarcina sp.]|uniref:ArnT family glycosyltransferase n=1 Tax=Methanosarcina sp. TaxID=2213 RepID=UPI003C71CEFC
MEELRIQKISFNQRHRNQNDQVKNQANNQVENQANNQANNQVRSNQKYKKVNYILSENPYFDIILAIICSGFFIALFAGHYFKSYQLLHALNFLKFLVIPLLSLCIYRYYKTRSKVTFFILLFSLALTWFWGFDFAYRWDAVQHVVRSKYYLSHSYFGSTEERHSFLYLIWGGFYSLFGESEILTNLINMFLGICGIFGIYAISKELYDDFTAFIALLVSFTFPVFFLVNKWAYLDMPFTSFVIITFFFLFKYLNTGSDRFFYLSLAFAFISFGTKVPGLVLFPAIFLGLIIYRQMNRKTFILTSLMFLFSVFFYLKVMYYSKIMDDFSIITPLTFGTDVIMIWAGFLKQEISQYIYSGIFFLSIFAFLKSEGKNKPLLYFLLAVQILLLIISEIYPSKSLFWFPLLPLDNYSPYYILLGLLILSLLISIGVCKTRAEVSKSEAVMLIWIASFTAFFIINGKIYDYGLKPLIDIGSLDYRYLMPAFPALIILFSLSISKMLRSDYSEKTRFIIILVLALTLVFNFITATNLTFYYANSGNARLEGYQCLSEQSPEVVYTHWPFHYGDGYDIGGLTWEKDNITVRNIESDHFDTSGDRVFLLFDTHFYSPEKLINSNTEKIEAKTFLLNPFSTSVSGETVNSVYVVEVEKSSVVFADGFYNVEYWDDKPIRWMESNSTFYLYSEKDMNTTLIMQVESFYREKTLKTYVNGKCVSRHNVPVGYFSNLASDVSVKKGMNTINLIVPEGSDKPCDVFEMDKEDTRNLSIAVQDIRLY